MLTLCSYYRSGHSSEILVLNHFSIPQASSHSPWLCEAILSTSLPFSVLGLSILPQECHPDLSTLNISYKFIVHTTAISVLLAKSTTIWPSTFLSLTSYLANTSLLPLSPSPTCPLKFAPVTFFASTTLFKCSSKLPLVHFTSYLQYNRKFHLQCPWSCFVSWTQNILYLPSFSASYQLGLVTLLVYTFAHFSLTAS